MVQCQHSGHAFGLFLTLAVYLLLEITYDSSRGTIRSIRLRENLEKSGNLCNIFGTQGRLRESIVVSLHICIHVRFDVQD